jgi:hypothetical protein
MTRNLRKPLEADYLKSHKKDRFHLLTPYRTEEVRIGKVKLYEKMFDDEDIIEDAARKVRILRNDVRNAIAKNFRK